LTKEADTALSQFWLAKQETSDNLRAGEALHLAICANHGASLCTLDRRLAEAAPRVGVPVREVTPPE
jgi:predicted nucleic acid-binding protein